MITWQHGLWVYFFSRRTDKAWQFVLGSMLPDYIYLLVMLLMLATSKISLSELLQLTPEVFSQDLRQLYPWAIKADLWGHSVVIWSGMFFVSLFRPLRFMVAFVIGWGDSFDY